MNLTGTTRKKDAELITLIWILMMALILFYSSVSRAQESETGKVTFTIHSFYIEGNTILEKEMLTSALKQFSGEGKTAEDVELARDALEKLYHISGFPTVLVNIPEQTVDDGIVRLQVIESKIKRVRVVGNKYFTMEYINDHLPSIQPGKILYLPNIREELSDINRNPDLKIAPILIPGRELGTIDVELKAEDSLPLHGSLEVNNRSTHTTTDTRVNGMIRYDNLWQKGHSISGQFQVSPEDTEEVFVLSTSYSLPAPWAKKHLMVGYYIDSDSETASGEGFNIVGKGRIFGFRYLLPLQSVNRYDHSLTMGFDWKDFEEDTLGETLPIEYMPFTFGYASSLVGKNSITQFSVDINYLIRDLFMNDMDEFQAKRTGSTGNYIYVTAGMEHRRDLFKKFSLFFKIDGQLTDQPLVDNEQYSAGGVSSVRGYKESEMMADNALHSTIELFSPPMLEKYPLVPYVFYDFAWLAQREALPGEYGSTFLQSTGVGITGRVTDYIEYKLDWGVALKGTDDTDSGDQLVHFKVGFQF